MAVNHRGPHDEPLDPADAQIGALYREAATESPPAHVDRAVAAAARVAPGAPKQPRASWWLPWRFPFAAAALATVLATVVLLTIEREPERVTALPRHAERAPEPSAPAPAPEPSAQPAQSAAKSAGPKAAGANRRAAPRAAADEQAKADAQLQAEHHQAEASRAGASPAPEVEQIIAELQDAAPERWIQRLQALRRAGRTDAAVKIAAEFRRRFPDVRLPPELE